MSKCPRSLDLSPFQTRDACLINFPRAACSEKVLDGGALGQKLISGLLDGSLGDLVVKVESCNGSVLSWSGRAREGEHDAFGDVVEGAVSLESN